ncbi:hypothetical protein FRC04_009801 [Tulasnella sp. 424]|nr:hypothetical protein FRC04_009801 [Tulasnella sp. 424]
MSRADVAVRRLAFATHGKGKEPELAPLITPVNTGALEAIEPKKDAAICGICQDGFKSSSTPLETSQLPGSSSQSVRYGVKLEDKEGHAKFPVRCPECPSQTNWEIDDETAGKVLVKELLEAWYSQRLLANLNMTAQNARPVAPRFVINAAACGISASLVKMLKILYPMKKHYKDLQRGITGENVIDANSALHVARPMLEDALVREAVMDIGGKQEKPEDLSPSKRATWDTSPVTLSTILKRSPTPDPTIKVDAWLNGASSMLSQGES